MTTLKCFDNLPDPLQELAKRNFQLLKADPWHPSLHFKRIGGFWSVRIGLDHRALALEDGQDFIWVWIGTYDEYERMLKQANQLRSSWWLVPGLEGGPSDVYAGKED